MRNGFVLLIALIGLIVLVGCNEPEKIFLENTSAEIPADCVEFKDDVCGLFECTVDLCWCEESPDRILLYGSVDVQDESEVIQTLRLYLNANYSEAMEIKNVVELNSLFFNVFVEDGEGNELVFTMARDGTIIKTLCGV